MITGIIEVTQDPEQAGSTLKILSLRLRGMKGSLEEMGEEVDDNVENISKMQGQVLNLTKGRVNIFDNAGEFRSTYEIMQDIAGVWDELSSTAQADLLETIAGKHRANSVMALLSNWENVEAAVKSATEAEGSAARENAKYVDSIQGRLDKMTTSWQSFADTFMNSNFLKGGISFITSMIEGVESLIDTFGTIPTLLSVFTAFESLNGIGLFKTVEDQATLSGKKITNIFSDAARQTVSVLRTIGIQKNSSFKESIDADIAALEKYTEASEGFLFEISESDFNNIFKNASESAKKFAASGKLATDGIDAFVNSQKAAQVSILAQNKSLGNAKAIIKEYYSGCKNVVMGTDDFAKAVGKTNPQLAKQLSVTKNAKSAFAGYITSLVGAKVASIALEVATMALNTAITMGISALISWGISKLDEWTETADELSERVDEIVSKFNDQQGELVKNKASFKSDAERYAELSKRVNELGENVSLTSDEYSEYQNIVNSIAEQVPSLVSGYDSQGNAILNVKGNVEDLTSAYEKLIHAQNQEILTQSASIEKDFDNTVKDNNSQGFWKQLAINAGFGSFVDYDLTSRGAETLNKLLNAKVNGDDVNEIIKQIISDEALYGEIDAALKNANIDTNKSLYAVFGEVLEKEPEKIKGIIDNFYGELDIEQMKSLAQATISEAFDVSSEISGMDYSGISETLQNVARQVVGNLDYDFYEELRNNGGSVEDWVKGMLDQLNAIGESDGKEIEAAFNLQTKFNGGDIPYGEYVSGIKDIEKTIDGLDLNEETKNQLKLSLNTDEVKKEYDALTQRLVDISTKDWRHLGHFSGASDAMRMATEDAKKFLDSLTSSEYSVFVDLVASGEVDLSQFDIESFRKYLEEEAKFLEAMNYTIAIDVETESLDALNSALSESVSATGLSSDSITALKGRYSELASQGYDLSEMFEETSNGIHLNKKAVSELEKAYASQKLSETKDKLTTLKDRYDDLTDKINNCSDASERADLYRDQQDIAQKINDLGTLAAQYEGLASAYNAWQNVESSGSERDMYESIIEGFENIGDEISRGWYDDGTIKFLELMTGKTDLAGESASELKKIWKDLDNNIENTSYSVKDFFTVNDDGDSTSTGVYNFLRAVQELEGHKDVFKNINGDIEDLVKIKDGKIVGFNFDIVGGDEAIAEALGISEELVQIMLRAADDAGFVVTLDGNWTQFADLKDQAEKANDAIKKLSQTNDELKNAGFGDYEFNFGADSIEDINTELDKAKELLNSPAFQKDGKFNLEMPGAEDALKIAETLQIAKQQLEEPAYMSIDTSELQKELQEPVKLLQQYEEKAQKLELYNLTPDINQDKIKELNSELDEIAKSLEALPEETKIDLGINDKNYKQIREELENGTIEVPTELTIEANMDKSLEDLVTLGLLEQGLIDEKTAKIRLGLEVEVEKLDTTELSKKIAEVTNSSMLQTGVVDLSKIVGKYTGEEQEVVLKFIADPSDVENYDAPEDKEAVVKFVADSIDVEGYEPEDKQAYAKYLVDGGNLDAYTPEQKEAIVKYFTEDSNIENYQGEDKEAIVKFLAETSEADGYTPQDRQAIARFIKDSLEVDTYQMPTNKWAYAKYLKDTYDIDVWTPEEKDGVASYTPFLASTSLPSITGGIAWYTPKISGTPKVNGTANVNGTAFANGTTGRAFKQGDWGTKKTETALTGELGQELVVYKNRYWTVGDNGAEFARIPKGAIVFNHKQTEEILTNGKVTSGGGRGKVLANGTAFAQGTAFSSGSGGGEEPSVVVVGTNKNTGKSYTKSTDDSAKDFEETFDLIEIAIDRVERAIDQLDTKANSVYRSWSERNSNLTSEISKVSEEISLQERAYQEYMNAAAGTGLSSSWVSKIKNGTIDISTVTDEALAEKIKDYQEWYEKALDCKDAIRELQEQESKLYAQRFQNLQTQYDGILQGYEHTEAMLNEYISQAEEQGYLVSKKYYESLVTNEKQNINALKQEQAELIAARDEAVASGKIAKQSEEWYNMCAEIDSVTQAIEEGETSLLSYAKAMEEIDWSVFDLIQERISGISEEADFLIELMSNKDLFDDNGKLTSQGSATLALHAQNANSYMYAADTYGEEIVKLDKQIESDPYNQDLINRRNELLELQRESILSYEQEKESIKSLLEDAYSKELESLDERIQKYEESLDAQKDLLDYQNKVEKSVKNISSLRKQLSAYEGFDDEETKATVQRLKLELEEAESELKETEYDKLIQDSEILLSSLYDEYELLMNQRLDNTDALLSQIIESANANATSIQETLTSETDKVGITLSNAMNSIWNSGDGNAKSVLTMYGEDFKSKSATIITTLNGIKSSVNSMVSSLNKEATTKTTANKTTTSAKKNPTTSSTSTSSSSTKTTTTKKSSSGDGTPKIGDRVKYVSGQYYYDSQGSKPLGSKNKGEYVYITNINTRDWATHGFHISTGNKLGKGDLGWLKLNQLSGYASGKEKFYEDETAWTQENKKREFIVRPSDGAILTPIAKGDSVLNAAASGNIWNMANSPAEFIKENLGIGSTNVPNASNVNNTYTQHIDNVVFDFKNVKNYDEMLAQMQKDKNFENLVLSMSINRIAGKSKLAKGKSIR